MPATPTLPTSPSLPTVPSYTFRHYATRADIPRMQAVHDACRQRDRTDPDSVCYRLPQLTVERYTACVEEAPANATLLVTADDVSDAPLVAQAWMEAWGHGERLYLWQVWVTPDARGHGLGTTMLHWGENLARTLHGDDPRPALHLANATEHEIDAVALLYNEGYHLSFVSPELAFTALETVPEPQPPAGITLRPLSPETHHAVAHALSEANLNPPGHESRWTGAALEERLALENAEWQARIDESDPALSVVAWAEAGSSKEIAGAYLCRRTGSVGEISQVAVRASWRGRGVARALAMQSLRSLHAAGCTSARLFTSIGPDEIEPTEGPYAMYRKFGFAPIARHLRFRKAMER